MTTLGNTATPSYGWAEYGINTTNQIGQPYTMPNPGGLISAIHGYWAAESASGTGYVCIWNASGTLLGSVAVTVSTGSNSPGGQAWNSATLGTPVFVAGGATFYIGWWMPQSSGMVWSYNNDSNHPSENAAPGSPGSLSTGSHDTYGSIASYVDYTPTGAWVYDGSQWNAGPVYVNTGTSGSPVWTAVSGLQVWNGSSWVNAS